MRYMRYIEPAGAARPTESIAPHRRLLGTTSVEPPHCNRGRLQGGGYTASVTMRALNSLLSVCAARRRSVSAAFAPNLLTRERASEQLPILEPLNLFRKPREGL